MKKTISVFDYANHIAQALSKGILLTTKAADTVNTMTIGWGMLGIEWGKPIFIALVRKSRFTKQLLDQNPAFTVNIPYGNMQSKIIGYCGSKSGKEVNKIKDLGLTLEAPQSINVPGIKELPLTLECKVIYKQEQDQNEIPLVERQRFYPQDVDGSHPGANREYHILYHGEIVNAYLIEDEA